MASIALSDRCLVTIVTPARAAADTLPRTFASVARQTVGAWQHLVVASHSDEETAAVARVHALRDRRITLLAADAATAAAARNAALPAARGDYILFLDADDTIGPRHLEQLLARAEETGADAVCGGFRRVSPLGRPIAVCRAPEEIADALTKGPITAIHAMLFRNSLVRELDGFDPKLRTNEDWDLCLRALGKGARFATSSTKSADYWSGLSSLTSDGAAMVEDRFEVVSRLVRRGGAGNGPIVELDALKSVLWNGTVALARGASPDGLVTWLLRCPPAHADAGECAETVLGGLAVGFACRPEEVEERLEGRWEELARFLFAVAERCDDEGLAGAVLRSLEWHLARLGTAWRSRRIGGSEVLAAADWLRRHRAKADTDQLIVRVPLARPRSVGTHAFAPQAANGRRPAALLFMRACSRLLDSSATGGSGAAGLRDKALRGAVLAARLAKTRPGKQREAPNVFDPVDPQTLSGDERWEAIFRSEDPWNYHCQYEQRKYERTLSLLPDRRIGRALELACAEGLFTLQLACRVEQLTAADISPTALSRARKRCEAQGLGNVTFEEFDFFEADIGTGWDLIVCSEVLYYMRDPPAVSAFAERVASALAPGGMFLHAHAYEVADSKDRTGFDWGDSFAAGTICAALAAEGGLTLVRAIETELYRVEIYRKNDGTPARPAIEHASVRADMQADLAADVVWNGAVVTRQEAEAERCYRVPVLLYHSVARAGPAALSHWRVDPDELERQLVFLRRRGYRSPSFEEWDEARLRSGALSGRPVVLTFDDGFQDFADVAWPIVKRHGFGAHVFLVTGRIGATSDWDAHYGPPVPLMSWDTIRTLADGGVTFGSHLHSHKPLDRLGFARAETEMRQSRELIKRQTGTAPTTLATPYGISTAAFEELARKVGYARVFGVDGGFAPVLGPRLRTPRIEIAGDMDLAGFAAAIGAAEAPDGRDLIEV